jgi:hypothetical protein
VKNVGFIQPSTAYVSITYTHDPAVPITYGANVYPYGTWSYPIMKPETLY